MELDELKSRWQEQDKKLDDCLRLNQRLLRESLLGKADTALRRLSRLLWFELVVNVAGAILVGSFLGDHVTEPRFFLPAIALQLGLVAVIIAGASIGGDRRHRLRRADRRDSEASGNSVVAADSHDAMDIDSLAACLDAAADRRLQMAVECRRLRRLRHTLCGVEPVVRPTCARAGGLDLLDFRLSNEEFAADPKAASGPRRAKPGSSAGIREISVRVRRFLAETSENMSRPPALLVRFDSPATTIKGDGSAANRPSDIAGAESDHARDYVSLSSLFRRSQGAGRPDHGRSGQLPRLPTAHRDYSR